MKELYKSNAWKSIYVLDRAQLLLVIEGHKSGTIIGNFNSLKEILKITDLEYKIYSDKNPQDITVKIAKKEHFKKEASMLSKHTKDMNEDIIKKIEGWFLGYPKCCIDEYVRKRTPEEISNYKKGFYHLINKFNKELYDKIIKENDYPIVFDYRPPSFTPCSIDCKESIRILTLYKNALDSLDSEAGKSLVKFNRASIPERLAFGKI